MKTRLDIYLDAQALAASTIGETDSMEIDGKLWDVASEKNHKGKDFELFKADFRNARNNMLALKKISAPSEAKTPAPIVRAGQPANQPAVKPAIKPATVQPPAVKK